MNKSGLYLKGAILSGIFLIIGGAGIRICSEMVRYGDDAEALWVLIPFSVVLIVLLVLCIIGCIRHRKDPKSTSEKPLAETSGFHMSGLPCAGTPNVDLKLYRDKILFEIWLNHTGTKKQTVALDINKVTSVQKIANVLQTSVVSQNTSTTINGSDYPHDYLAICYTSDCVDKQILISLPTLTNASRFVKQYEKINPNSNQPIEL